ncbi:unnamed protein product [Schistocephalus solidus]|uniref:Redox-regulated molecular chaperone Hsp33 n=1 Tax=Schistocephalus solidus TaxID=70667 RepID=A0A183T930_SCHSO|nr:unnamed protein product [Schistocephalus solidus]
MNRKPELLRWISATMVRSVGQIKISICGRLNQPVADFLEDRRFKAEDTPERIRSQLQRLYSLRRGVLWVELKRSSVCHGLRCSAAFFGSLFGSRNKRANPRTHRHRTTRPDLSLIMAASTTAGILCASASLL